MRPLIISFVLLFAVLVYVFSRESSTLSADDIGNAPLIQSEELHEGMEQILTHQQSYADGESAQSDRAQDGSLPDYDEHASVDSPIPEELDSDAARFHHLTVADDRQERHRQWRDEIRALEKELPRDELTVRQLHQNGDAVRALELRQQIESKQQRLEQLQNNPPEDMSDEE